MKKAVVLSVALVMVWTAFVGCDTLGINNEANSPGLTDKNSQDGNSQGENGNEQGENGNKTDKDTCPSNYDMSNITLPWLPLIVLKDYHRFQHYSGGFGHFYVIKSKAEKNELIANLKTEAEKSGWNWEPCDTLLEKYDDNYFKNNNLVAIDMTESSGGNKLDIASVTVKNNELNLLINRYAYGITDDVKRLGFLIPVEKCFFNGDKVNFVNVDCIDMAPSECEGLEGFILPQLVLGYGL